MSAHSEVESLLARMGRSIVGQEHVVERLVLGLLADGHVLIEGLPGLAKTRAVKAMAKNLACDLSRIQFTPDLLPADVTGTEVLAQDDAGTSTLHFRPGPVFANLVLGDEINRAPAKVQSALLEAMEERQVTVAGESHAMPEIFMVLATQNPVEQEGTYPLPEAQMDRFLMHVMVEYPEEDAEIEIIRMVRSESGGADAGDGEAPIPQDAVLAARREIFGIHVAESVEAYIVALIHATRWPERHDEELAKWVSIGASPRGAIGLDRCARAHAWLRGRDHVTPDDVRAVVHDVLRHRITPSYEADAEGVSTHQIVTKLVSIVAVA